MKRKTKIKNVAAQRAIDRGSMAYDNMIIREINSFRNEELIEIAILRMTKENLYEILNEVTMDTDRIETRLHNMEIVDDELERNINSIYNRINDLLNKLSS